MVDIQDLKSWDRKVVRVRVSPWAMTWGTHYAGMFCYITAPPNYRSSDHTAQILVAEIHNSPTRGTTFGHFSNEPTLTLSPIPPPETHRI